MTDARAQPVRDAATVILVRSDGPAPAVLMGQRGEGAAFMPSKYVFPGGALDAGDAAVPLAGELRAACQARLDLPPGTAGRSAALAAAAIRELWEETGLRLGRPGTWPGTPPANWEGFAATGLVPDASALRFLFRAITPPGRPRRFDARFFLADAAHLAGDPDDFSAASDELSHLHWVPLSEARNLNLPFITEVVLGEAAAHLAEDRLDRDGVAFFDNSSDRPAFRRLR
jgi:8-oxo-dGTP pyrophosphatase MutT (NUDIX family)